ncbi:HD-GYP domain-containing protein [Bacillus infantis]|uniref:HD-GYP domain-containing protein n=1 Tax=Bacillus infantis TaxID=324767 RepID=A0A5D4RHI6_9BACI|nr:HD-GYP domain-containing protein [Bacillus infantis]TYS49138.1 HD-GYP domain-containing protein [Bacillus infantis]
MDIYNRFLKKLLINYIFGSLIAVLAIGATFIFTTIDARGYDKALIWLILAGSMVIMFFTEGFFFRQHIRPIRAVFLSDGMDAESVKKGILRLKQFPVLTVKRIMLPHLLGLTIPAASASLYLISAGELKLSYYMVLYAAIAAFLVASMHALVEFYLTLRAIKPVLAHFKAANKSGWLAQETPSAIPIKKKFRLTVLAIGVLPVLIFMVAAQIKLEGMGMGTAVFWQWAAVVIFITVCYAMLTAKYMAEDIEEPISRLQTLMSEAENQNFAYLKDNVYTDEFSEVFTGFNIMIAALKQRDETNRQLLESFMTVLSAALDARDPYTSGHSMRVASFSRDIGKRLGLHDEELMQLYQTALLHDIGKIGVPDGVLQKEGKLTDEEFEYIKAHPVIGETILKQVQPAGEVASLLPGIRSHHERIDGQGYPDGLQGEEIPYFGRIIAVADSYDAMTSDRPYRKGMPPEKALHILESGKGTQWDPQVADAFIELARKMVQTEAS